MSKDIKTYIPLAVYKSQMKNVVNMINAKTITVYLEYNPHIIVAFQHAYIYVISKW